MCRRTCCAILLTLLLCPGCKEGKSTAPSKDPDRPNATRKLTVKAPSFAKQIHQNGTAAVAVEVVRENFNGAITIEFRQLPAGVTVTSDDLTIPVGKDVLSVGLKATADAPVAKGHTAKVAVKAKDEPDLPEAVVDLKLDVLDKGDR